VPVREGGSLLRVRVVERRDIVVSMLIVGAGLQMAWAWVRICEVNQRTYG